MIKHAPDALIVPITINNSWKTLRYGKFPMGLGSRITFRVHKPMSVNQHEDKLELIRLVEAQVKSSIA
jgi:1-acyl-sn-glycerol-3-phosphate acyltransferase